MAEGRVRVNGETAMIGQRADSARDEITVDGVPIARVEQKRYLMLNKPRGYVCTLSDEKGRPTVAELVKDCGARVYPVGRLDMDSEGLLLLTDDGALTHRLTHPSHGVEKEYRVKVRGDLGAALPLLRRPMLVDGETLCADRAERSGPGELTVVLHQGKNRQVRRMCAAAGLTVLRLIRIREGQLTLDGLPEGRWRPLSAAELELLRK